MPLRHPLFLPDSSHVEQEAMKGSGGEAHSELSHLCRIHHFLNCRSQAWAMAIKLGPSQPAPNDGAHTHQYIVRHEGARRVWQLPILWPPTLMVTQKPWLGPIPSQ